MRNKTRLERRQSRHRRVRRRVRGTQDRPRLSVMFSNRGIYVQFIDDGPGLTLASASSAGAGGRCNVETARKVGAAAAEAARAKGISRVVVDRGGYRFHTRLAAMVDALVRGGVRRV